LDSIGLFLEGTYKSHTEEEVKELWIDLRNAMPSSKWDLEKYWNFIYRQSSKSDEVIRHDVLCIENVKEKSRKYPADELGPRVLFLTIDSKLLMLRKRYKYVISVEQFLEYMLPYLFLSDVPIQDAERFPNRLLSAQLGSLLVRRPPEMTELVESFLTRPEFAGATHEHRSREAAETAAALSSDRFEGILKLGPTLDPIDREEAARQISAALQEIEQDKKEISYENRQLAPELEKTRSALEKQERAVRDLEAKVEKLQKTLKYWKGQARGRE
jgi:hypothetical protein